MKCRSILFVVLWPLLGVGAERPAAVEFSARGGLRHSPEALSLTSDHAAPVYFTTNGAPASPTNGVCYTKPLRLVTTTTVRAVAAGRGINVAAEQIITFIFSETVVRQTGAGLDDDFSPTRLWQKLRACPEFRESFARQARRHLTGTGALMPAQAANRFRQLSDALDLAIVAESARWGDYRRDAHPYKDAPYELYTRDSHWRPEVKRLLNDYFPKRSSAFIEQLKAVQLYPAD